MGIVAMTFLIVVLPYPPSRISGYVASGVGGNQPCVYGEGCAGDPAGPRRR